MGIELDPCYATAISTFKNFRLKDDFPRLFPEIASSLDEDLDTDCCAGLPIQSATAEHRPPDMVVDSNVNSLVPSLPAYEAHPDNTPPFADFDVDSSMSIVDHNDLNMFPTPVLGLTVLGA